MKKTSFKCIKLRLNLVEVVIWLEKPIGNQSSEINKNVLEFN